MDQPYVVVPRIVIICSALIVTLLLSSIGSRYNVLESSTVQLRSLYEVSSNSTPVKGYKGRSIFILDSGVKHHIPDWITFLGLGFTMANVKMLPDDEVEKFPEGEGVTPINAQYDVDEHGNVIKERCPCERRNHKAEFDNNRLLCLFDSAETRKFEETLKESNIAYEYIQTPLSLNTQSYLSFSIKRCLVVVEIVSETSLPPRPLCPGLCIPFPLVTVAKEWLFGPIDKNRALTCTAQVDHILGNDQHDFSVNKNARSMKDALALILGITRRRIEECRERNDWPLIPISSILVTSNTTKPESIDRAIYGVVPPESSSAPAVFVLTFVPIKRRKIRGLILWLGSIARRDITERQVLAMEGGPYHGSESDIGWIASEDQHPCRLGTTTCEDLSQYMLYHLGMPTSRMNFAGASWSCGQRRPLRALAHTLSLYDPTFVIVGDDDTYVNYPLLVQKFMTFVVSEIDDFILGELTMGKKVTYRGFFNGGSGYIFGKKSVDALSSFEIQAVPDKCRSNVRGGWLHNWQIDQLSVAKDAIDISNTTKCLDCAYYSGPNYKASLDVRLIDACNNMMSNERTCYHSDHAMSRCLLHGAYSHPVHADCWTGFKPSSADQPIKMCMVVSVCDVKIHFTCHRWFPKLDDHKAVEMIFPNNTEWYR